jgi:hypothetical protein
VTPDEPSPDRLTNLYRRCIDVHVVYLRMTLGAVAIAVGLVAAAIQRIAQLLRPRPAAESPAVLHRPSDVLPVGAVPR